MGTTAITHRKVSLLSCFEMDFFVFEYTFLILNIFKLIFYPQCHLVLFVITIVITKYRNYGKQKRATMDGTLWCSRDIHHRWQMCKRLFRRLFNRLHHQWGNQRSRPPYKGTEGTRGLRELRCLSKNILDNPSHPSSNRDNLKNYEMFRNSDTRRPRRSKRLKNPKREWCQRGWIN